LLQLVGSFYVITIRTARYKLVIIGADYVVQHCWYCDHFVMMCICGCVWVCVSDMSQLL